MESTLLVNVSCEDGSSINGINILGVLIKEISDI